MPQRLWVQLAAPHYAKALLALHQANRAWHRLDSALVKARQNNTSDPCLDDAWDALGSLERQLGSLARLLGR